MKKLATMAVMVLMPYYHLKAWLKDNPSVVAILQFDLNPPISSDE